MEFSTLLAASEYSHIDPGDYSSDPCYKSGGERV